MEGSIRATKSMCALCFEILLAKLRKQSQEAAIQRFNSDEPQASIRTPLFVTWKIGAEKDLRGCIGTFDQSNQIGALLPRYALISALDDSRFSPITLDEVHDLHVSVSLLTNFQPIQNPLAWEIGRHGIEIELKTSSRSYSGTYLPEVSREQGWNQATTLINLFRKAGYKADTANKIPEDVVQELGQKLKVTTYESSKMSMSFPEFLRYLAERDGN